MIIFPFHGSPLFAVGSFADNAATQSFFGILKHERFSYNIGRWHDPRPAAKIWCFEEQRRKLFPHMFSGTG